MFDQNHNIVYEGQFLQNKLHGQGTKEILGDDRITYGKFSNGQIRNMDVMTDERE